MCLKNGANRVGWQPVCRVFERERERGVGDGLSSFPAHNGKTDMVTSTWKVWAWSGDQKLTLHMCI